jgi:hypothetical protein
VTRRDLLRSEASLLASVKATAKGMGLPLYHTRWSVGSEAGWPDIALVDGTRGPPTLCLWELKAEDGRLTERQARWLAELEQCERLDVRVVRPSDWEALRDELVKRRWG